MSNTASPSYTELQALGEPFASMSQPVLEAFITEAECGMSSVYFGGRYHEAALYKSAHLAYTISEGPNGVTGPASSLKVGDMQTAFAGAGAYALAGYGAASWGTSTWGRLYYRILMDRRFGYKGVLV